MKRSSTLGILFLSIALFFMSCSEQKTDIVEEKSPNGAFSIQVFGTRKIVGDPWKTTVRVKKGEKNVDAEVEVFATNIDKDNVSFAWESPEKCIVSIVQQDGVPITVPVTYIED